MTKGHAKRVAYLFKDEPKEKPLEQHLQDDYHDFMVGSLGTGITVEKSDVAGGRADVCFAVSGQRLVAELKKEETNASFDSLFSSYSGQAIEYQNTNWRVGLLVVLDAMDKPRGAVHARDQVHARRVRRVGETGFRGLVVVRVPGNRLRPSSVRK